MTTPSFMAIVDFSTVVTGRSTALAQLERERHVVGAMPGCLGFRIFADRQSDTGITVVHEWTDTASFEGYLASAAFRRSGDVLRPIMSGPPTSRRFRVELLETVVRPPNDRQE